MAADDSNPFADIYSEPTQPAPAAPAESDNPFADIYKDQNADDTSFLGAAGHSLERGIAPALASIPAMGAGAELGGAIGGLGGPAAPLTVPVGAVIGGFAGAFLGSSAVSAAQNWMLSQLPESWQDALGQSQKQQATEAEKQPVASFIGGLIPYALTMRPSFNLATRALPENATAVQRLMANPLTAHLFGGAVTGGMELGTEAANKESPNWTKIGIATAFGTIFNTPTKIGEALTEVGARPARQVLGRPEPVLPAGTAPEAAQATPEAAPAAAPKPADVTSKEWNETLLGQKPEQPPTVAQAGDAKVLGPGIDEAVFMGAHEQAPEALMTAQDAARTEAAFLRPEESTPSVQTVARRMEPDLFTQYDALQAQRDDLAAHPDVASVQQHITATEAQIRDLAPQVAAAYRRAADVVQAPTVEPPAPEPVQPTQPAPEGQQVPTGAAPTAPSRETLDAEQASIAQQVTANLIAAGQTPELAAANAALWGHYYRTRSAKFKGVLGSPMELYQREAPIIRGYGAPPPETAVGEAPAPRGPIPAETELFQPAYHGTPHIFDKFDSSKIGTGEGAQAFGHGLYMAGRKEVADYYRTALAGRPQLKLGDKSVGQLLGSRSSIEVGRIANDLGITAGNEFQRVTAIEEALRTYDLEVTKPTDPALTDPHKILEELAGDSRDIVARMEAQKNGEAKALMSPAQISERIEHESLKAEVYDALRTSPKFEPTVGKPGRLLTVDIPHDDELLSWDKPLNEQPKAVLDRLSTIAGAAEHFAKLSAEDDQLLRDLGHGDIADKPGNGLPAMSGSEFYNWLSKKLGGDANASAALREAGIPGHRFLDQQSRNPKALADARGSLSVWEAALRKTPDDAYIKGEVEARRQEVADLEKGLSHNYVIYDDSRINVLQYEQAKRAALVLRPGRQNLLKLFRDANASSFIHESGHQWLEDMLVDAVHPAAPGSLKDDALTVREALGMKPDQDRPTTRQHERWARWTEQYMREGVAPSPGLARVFAQFKTWLTQIYQSIKGLGAPINEDIRGVFDRMLAEEPNRTVISPEDLAREPSLPSIHEAEAAEAAPHEAHGIGDRIVAERDDYLARQPQEVQNEIQVVIAQHEAEARAAAGAEPTGEAGPGAGGPSAMVEGGGAPGAEPAGGAGGGEPGPQLGGGGAGVPERAGRPTSPGEPSADTGLRQQRSGAAGAAGVGPLVPAPSTLFGPAESPFVDKAGNIRIENLTSDQDVAQAIRDAAQENNEFIGDRRGVITDGQVLDLADALGMTPSQLNQRKLGEAFNAEQVVAARKLLIQSATDVRDIMAKAAAPTSTDEDVLAYAHAKARHQMIQAQVAGITAEAGRALRAFRSLAGDAQAVGVDQFLRTATGKTLFQLKEEAKLGAQLDTPMKVSKFVRDGQKRSFGSMVLEYWINGLISGPATHTTYMVGNVILSLEKAGPETLTAALIGNAARALGRQGEVVNFGEAVAKLRGAHLGIPAATQAAIDALKTGVTTRLPGETPRVLPFQPGSELARSVGINEAARYSDAMPALYGAVQGIQDGIVSLGALLKAGGVQGAPMVGLRYSPLGAIPDIAVRGVDVLPLGTVARLPSRAIAAIHSFFRTVNYSMEKNALAYRSAVTSGKTGTEFDAHVANLRQNPTTDMMASAVHQATEATLMGKGSEFVQALSKLTNVKILGFPFLKFVDPFVHIAGNIIDQSIVQRTPLGILAPEIRADLMGKNGTIAQDTAAARMLVGTALSIGFGSLAAQGLMSGTGPSDPREAAMWRLAGNQAHSVRIGNIWYDVHRLGPMGMLASVAADMYDVAHGASEGDMGKVGAALLQAFTHTMLDEGFGRGPADLIQALTDPQRYGPTYVRNQISSFVPFSVGMGQVARAMDPYSRQARSIMDAIKAKIPGLSQTLLPRRDIWGQAMPSTEVLGQPGLSAIYTTQVSNDPVNLAMLNLGIYPAQVDRKIRGVALTDEQFDQFSTLAGGMAKQQLDKIVGSGQWSQWPAQTQHDVIEATITAARETARNMMMARNPQIAADALKSKLAQLKPAAGE